MLQKINLAFLVQNLFYFIPISLVLGSLIINITLVIFIFLSGIYIVKNNIKIESAEDRVRIIKRSCFNGRRIVIFSGGEAKNDDELLKEIQAIKDGGGNGSIVGRNCFQRPKDKALELIDKMISIYKD